MTQDPSLRLLALDTATQRGSVALLDGSDLIAELRLNSLETHSARLLRSICFLLDAGGWKMHDLQLIASGIGPGSFTGIRIGVATALGLAQTLGIPFAGISGLDALTRQVPVAEGRLGVVMDAQRSQVYYAEHEAKRCEWRMVVPPGLWYPKDLKPKLARRDLLLVGDGAARYIDQLRSKRLGFPSFLRTDLFLAGSIGRLALARKRTWRSGEALRCDPLYIRLPDAKKPKARDNQECR